MKAIVDDKIPYIARAIESVADEVVYLPGKDFTPEVVADADVLVVRTRTRCDAALLAGSRVRFVATATIGYDHIDTAWCASAGISWANCPGCNAASVAQYVQSSLILLSRRHGRDLRGMTLGIVGAGNVGRRVADMARSMGLTVLLNDPPRAEAEGGAGFVTLDEVARRADIISLHTPLTRGGRYPTYHLADGALFASLARRPWLLNTSRGEVVDGEALAASGLQWVLDVWEHAYYHRHAAHSGLLRRRQSKCLTHDDGQHLPPLRHREQLPHRAARPAAARHRGSNDGRRTAGHI